MTRAQENTVDQIALQYGRVAVRDGFADRHLDVTAPSGLSFNVREDGTPYQYPTGNFSIDWSI